jgi:hypothetical protein
MHVVFVWRQISTGGLVSVYACAVDYYFQYVCHPKLTWEVNYISTRTKYLFGCISASIGEIYLKLHTSHFPHMCCKPYNSSCDPWIIKGTLLGNRGTFSTTTRLPRQGFSSNVVPRIFHACATSPVRLRSVNNYRHFTWRTKYIFHCFSAFYQGIFLKLHNPYFPRMRNTPYNLGSDESVIARILLEGQSTFSAVPRLAFERFTSNYNN